jgi:hypothetical protein
MHFQTVFVFLIFFVELDKSGPLRLDKLRNGLVVNIKMSKRCVPLGAVGGCYEVDVFLVARAENENTVVSKWVDDGFVGPGSVWTTVNIPGMWPDQRFERLLLERRLGIIQVGGQLLIQLILVVSIP